MIISFRGSPLPQNQDLASNFGRYVSLLSGVRLQLQAWLQLTHLSERLAHVEKHMLPYSSIGSDTKPAARYQDTNFEHFRDLLSKSPPCREYR